MTRAQLSGTLVWAVLVVTGAVIAVRASYTADLSAFLPRTPTPAQRLLIEQLRSGPASRLIMVAVEGADPALRARLVADLAQRLRADPAFTAVHDGDRSGEGASREFLVAHRYLLSDAVRPERFTVAGLHGAIAAALGLLATPEGLLLKPLFTRDPTGETLEVIDSLGPERVHTRDGVWSSRGGERALLIAQTRAAGSDTDAQEAACAAIRGAFAAAVDALPRASPAATLRMSGPGVLAVASRATIRGQVVRLSLLGFALIAALLLVVYRSPAALVLGLIPVASGALAGVAAVALGFGVVHGITLGFGVTLIGEAVDYSIYLFIQSQPQAHPPAPGAAGAGTPQPGAPDAERWRRSVWPTIRSGMLTSLCGFAVLLPSSFPGLAQLGLYSAAGVAAAALVTRYVLSAWLPHTRLGIRNLTGLGARLARAVEAARPARAAVALPAVLAALALVAHRDRLWSRELASLSPITAADQALDAELRADLGAPDARYVVVVSAADLEAVLAAAERVASRLTALTDDGVIGGFDSPTRYLPSLATQRRRQASLPAPAELQARLAPALGGLPLSAARLAPFVADVGRARGAPLLTRADLEGTAIAAGVDALLASGPGRASAFLPLTASPGGAGELPSAALGRLRTEVAQAAPGEALLLDLKSEADRLYAGYLRQAVYLSAAGIAAIVLLLSLQLSIVRAARVVAPLVLAVLCVAGALTALGAQLTILHVVGMLLIVAVGSNYALFFDRRAAEDADPSTLVLASLAVANLATVLGFGVLASSSVPVLAALGRTVAPGALLALVFAALLSGGAASRAAAPGPDRSPRAGAPGTSGDSSRRTARAASPYT